jgi:DNA-binding beta-propeller fold protein YncE
MSPIKLMAPFRCTASTPAREFLRLQPPTIATGTFPLGLTVDPSGKFVYVANDTASEVSMYTINSSTGNLTPTTSPTVATGAGPQGIAVDPSGEFVYVAQELPMSALTA